MQEEALAGKESVCENKLGQISAASWDIYCRLSSTSAWRDIQKHISTVSTPGKEIMER